MDAREVFRPRSNLVMAAITMAMASLTAGSALIEYGPQGGTPALLIASTVSYGAYLLFGRPKVIMDDDGIVIINPMQHAHVGWRRVDAIEARYTMSIEVAGRVIHAWAAPAPSRYHGRTVHPSELRGLPVATDRLLRPGESPRTHSGAAVYLARQRWQAAQSRASANAELTTRLTPIPALLLGLGVILSVASVLHA